MKRIIATVMCLLMITACAVRTANPVMVTQFGDTSKSCNTLMFEMENARSEMQRLIPETEKTGKNVALGVAGWFLIVPWFFMDFSDAEMQEYNAYRQRYNYLATVAMEKGCADNLEQIPSIEEMKKQYEEQQIEQGKDPNQYPKPKRN